MTAPIRLLIVEDMPNDAELMTLRLLKEGFPVDWRRVDNEPDYLAALTPAPDLILADWSLPQFSGLRALQLLRTGGLDIPFIIVSGGIGEEAAVDAMRQGAYDYVLKDQLGRLGQAVRRALEDKQLRDERKRAEEAQREREKEAHRLAEEYALMAEIGQIISSTLNIDEVYALFSAKVKTLLPYDRISINLMSKDGANLINRYVEGDSAPERNTGDNYAMTRTLTEAMIQNRAGAMIDSQDEDEVAEKYPGLLPEFKAGFRSFLSVPLISRDKPIGGLHFRSKRFRLYSGKDLKLAEGIANQIAGAVANAQLFNEHKQAEEALRESEQKYRTLVTQSPDGIFIVDLQGAFLAVNKAMCERLKYSEGEFLSMKIWDIVPEKYLDLHKKRLSDILRGETPNETAEYEVRGKDEKMHYIEVLSTPYFRENEVIGFQGIARDITGRKQAEKALGISEKRFRDIAEYALEWIWEVNAEGQYTYASQVVEKILGYSPEEILQKHFYDLFHPDDKESLKKAGFAAFATKQPFREFINRNVHKNGQIVWLSTNGIPMFDEKGNLLGYRGADTDITERKQAEEALRASEAKYRKLHESMMDGFAYVDMKGVIRDCNESYQQMLGYSFKELAQLTYVDLTPEKWHAYEERIVKEQILPRGYSEVYEKEYRKKDGTIFPVELRTFLIRDNSGQPAGMWAVVRDITDRKKVEQETASLQDQLRQSQKVEAIGQLAGGIAHDFNNLLTIIQGNSQLSLMDLQEGDPLRANIEEIREAAKRAADLTQQLLAFSRKQILEMRVLDLNQVLQRLDKMLRRVIGEDIHLTMLLHGLIWKVKADPGQIEQVIMNLSVNARDAMPEGGKLTIETANVELDEAYARKHIAVQPGRYVMFSMSDTGVGMAPEVRERIFEPFFTTKEKGKGTGLGLSTVYGIVKQSGGNVWVYSEPGQGTTFKIYLPQVDAPVEELREEVLKEISRGHETILLVEDEDIVRKLAARVLKKQGYKVLEAPDGGKAFMLCETVKEPIHLILTDVVMPGMSGRKLVDRLKEIHPETKVLYMSGYTDSAILHHGILEPGTNFIQKPFTIDGLARKVREALDK